MSQAPAARPWAPGAVTGIGSLPGTNPAEALRLVLGELPTLPHLPELPARGAGAELIGRASALLVDLPVEITAGGWTVTTHPGRDLRRARDLLERDLDVLHDLAGDHSGAFKVQVAGPWTLAANLELPTGHKIVSDHGAARDLAASLAEGVRAHLADLARRVPGARFVLQLDEPSLPAVLAGQVPTPSGYGTVRSVEPGVAEQGLRLLLQTAPPGGGVVHCCAAGVPLALIRAAGADAIAVDAGMLQRGDYDTLGEAVDSGVSLWLGVLPATDAEISLDTARGTIHRLWDELGFGRGQLAASVVPTPACGLAGATPSHVRRVLSLLRDTGAALLDDSED